MRGGRGGDRAHLADVQRDVDNAEVDVAAVEALLEERSGYRAAPAECGTLPTRRAIFEQEHGVDVSDKDFEWTVRRVGFGGGGRGGGRGAPRAPVEVGPMPAELRLQTEYGVLGHDYTRAPEDAQPMPADDFASRVNGLRAARLEAKKMRRYDEADALMAMLDLNVAVDDNARLWRADVPRLDPRLMDAHRR